MERENSLDLKAFLFYDRYMESLYFQENVRILKFYFAVREYCTI